MFSYYIQGSTIVANLILKLIFQDAVFSVFLFFSILMFQQAFLAYEGAN